LRFSRLDIASVFRVRTGVRAGEETRCHGEE
jgi:hypothetical protein